MSKICQITGKKAQIGNNVSHSKHRTKRSFDVNLFSKKFYYVEEGAGLASKLAQRVCVSSTKWAWTLPSSRLCLKAIVTGVTLK